MIRKAFFSLVRHWKFYFILCLCAFLVCSFLAPQQTFGGNVFSETASKLQDRMVKIYGAGGYAEMEEYQSGFFISADGLIATVFSPVLNSEEIECVLSDGSHFAAEILGIDPNLEIALLKISKSETPFFDLEHSAKAASGKTLDGLPILAFSNLFGVAVGNEAVSVQAGTISSTTKLEASRRAFDFRWQGEVYVLDVTTNNPGSAGGALVTSDGQMFCGMLGKELQHSRTGCWLNFAFPAKDLHESVKRILSGEAQTTAMAGQETRPRPERSLKLEELGLGMVPEIVPRTPAFVDTVRSDSRAAKADIQPDDLILYWNGRLVQSLDELSEELEFTDFQDPIRLTILRGEEMIEKEIP
ncbi:MAG: serine protease [Thermoguttaceae bacterium]|nr:serine protease [Thermoguttaceae bacterium]